MPIAAIVSTIGSGSSQQRVIIVALVAARGENSLCNCEEEVQRGIWCTAALHQHLGLVMALEPGGKRSSRPSFSHSWKSDYMLQRDLQGLRLFRPLSSSLAVIVLRSIHGQVLGYYKKT